MGVGTVGWDGGRIGKLWREDRGNGVVGREREGGKSDEAAPARAVSAGTCRVRQRQPSPLSLALDC